jgi:hypothetical protein
MVNGGLYQIMQQLNSTCLDTDVSLRQAQLHAAGALVIHASRDEK